MMNKKVGAIIKNEVERSIKNKWFVILNVVMLLLIVVTFNFNNIKALLKKNNIDFSSEISIYVEDNKNLAFSTLEETFEKYQNVGIEKKDSIEEFENANISEDIVLVKVLKDKTEYIKAQIISKEGVDSYVVDEIESALEISRNKMISKDKNLTDEEIEQIKSPIEVERIMLGQNVEGESIETSVLQIFSTYLIFFILLLCLNKIANTVSQEKMSKSIEYILTSITAKEYIISKVISMCITVVVQFVFIIAYAIIGIMIAALLNMNAVATTGVTADVSLNLGTLISGKTIAYVVLTFIFMCLTTFLQGVIQSVMSAKTTNIQEAGNATILLVMLNLVLYTVVTTLVNPVKTVNAFVYILSVLPIASMYFIPAMFIIGQASILQVIISLVILIASLPLALILAQKPFRNAILDFTTHKKEKKIEGIEKIISTREYQERLIERKSSSKKGLIIGFSVILLIVLQVVGSLLTSVVVEALKDKITWISATNLNLVATCIVFVISIYVPYLILKAYLPKEEKVEETKEEKKASLIKCIKYILVAIPIISIIQMICSFVIERLGIGVNVTESLGIFNYSGKLSLFIVFLQVAVLPAIFEELFVRKGVIGVLKNRGAIFATVISSLIFATIHMNTSQFIFAFLIGILFAIIRIRTKKMYPTMILHFLNNGFALIEGIFFGNMVFMEIFTYFLIAINAVGFCLLIYMIYLKVMELKDKESIQRLKEQLDYRKIKLNLVENMFVFKDFTFGVTVILSVTLFLAIDKILTLI